MSNPSPLESIFFAALEKQSSAERKAFLDEVCAGNDELRGSVERMLAAQADAGSFLESPPPGVTSAVDSSELSEQPGTIIGPYKLLEQIGEGGMGVVFMAEQQEPVRRRVALKVIKPGMDTRQVIARFEAERQALAVMDHPSIARVLDAGATDSGRPYFVMELVRGVPITTHCDESHLAVRERLELFASVCEAIQHAHTKGIVHRDIKPTNVLVTRQDGRAVVKVIDFGVAKAMGQQLTEKTLFTNFAQMIGTPLYMSPEQAERSGVDIDTRSDIYSLGVLLYELLTGSTPVDAEQMKQAAFDEVRRIIREDEPQTPSARISGSHTLPAIAARRHIEPARLSKLVRGELDWIVMKALDKDRGRRYETANAFAADLLHYLHDEPVQACPPSATYRFGKFARRNKAALLTIGLVAVALIIGTVVSTAQAIRARRAEELAEARLSAETEARQLADKARAAEADQRTIAEAKQAEAEANYQKAKAAVDKYFTLVSESTLFDVPGLEPLRKDLLEAAMQFYEGAALERTDDPAPLADLAATHLRLSQLYYALNRVDDSIVAIRRALDIVGRLRRDHPGAGEQLPKLAGFWKGMRWTQSDMKGPSDPVGAFQTLLKLEATWKELAEQYPSEIKFQSDLVLVQALIASSLRSAGRLKEFIAYFRSALAISKRLVAQNPDVPQYREGLAMMCTYMAEWLRGEAVSDEAIALTRQAVQLCDGLVAEYPNVPAYRLALAKSLAQLGDYLMWEKPQEAEPMLGRALELAESLVRDFPGHPVYQEFWVEAAVTWVQCPSTKTNDSNGKELVRRATEALDALIKVSPKDRISRQRLGWIYHGLASKALYGGGDAASVEQLERRALAIFRELTIDFPNKLWYWQHVGHSCRNLGENARRAGRLDEAREHIEAAADAFAKTAAGKNLPQRDDRAWQAGALSQLAQVLAASGHAQEAEQAHRRANELAESLVREFPDNRNLVGQVVEYHGSAAGRLWSSGQPDEAAEHYHAAVAILEKRARKFSAQPDDTRLFAIMTIHLARIMAYGARTTDLQETCRLCLRATEILDGRLKEDPIRRAFLAVAVRAYAERLLKEPERRPEAEQMMTWSTPVVEQTIKDVAALDELTAVRVDDGHLAAETERWLAKILAWTSRPAEAEEMWLRAIRSFEAIGQQFMIPHTIADYPQHVGLRVEQFVKNGQSDEAMKLLNKVIDAFDTLAAEHPSSAELYRAFQVDILFQLTAILVASGHAQEALVAARKSVDISEALTRDFPNNENYRSRMASALNMLVEALVKAGQGDEATATRQRTIKIWEALLADQPKDRQARQQLAWALGEAANSSQSPADRALREQFLRRALALHTELANEPPGDPGHFEQTGHLFRYLGWFERDQGRLDEARQNFEKGVDVFAKLAANKDVPQRDGFYRDFEANTHLELAYLLAAGGKSEDAEQAARQAADMYEALASQYPDHPDYLKKVADAQRVFADRLEVAGRHEESEKVFRRLIANYEKLAADFPDIREYRDRLTRSYTNVFDVLLAQGKQAEVEETIRQAIEMFEKLAAAHPAVPDYRRSRAAFQRRLAQLQASDKRAEEAEKSFLVAINSYQKIIVEFPQYEDLWRVYDGLAQALAASNRPREADEARRKMVELAPNNAGTLNNMAWGFATSADLNARNASLAVELAKKGIDLEPNNDQLSNTLGVAYYRAGNWQDAIEWLKKSMDRRKGGDSLDWFILAMANWQLDHKDEARKWNAKAVEWMDANAPTNDELKRFRAEAAELLGVNEQKDQ